MASNEIVGRVSRISASCTISSLAKKQRCAVVITAKLAWGKPHSETCESAIQKANGLKVLSSYPSINVPDELLLSEESTIEPRNHHRHIWRNKRGCTTICATPSSGAMRISTRYDSMHVGRKWG